MHALPTSRFPCLRHTHHPQAWSVDFSKVLTNTTATTHSVHHSLFVRGLWINVAMCVSRTSGGRRMAWRRVAIEEAWHYCPASSRLGAQSTAPRAVLSEKRCSLPLPRGQE